jgi:hypothetical protein
VVIPIFNELKITIEFNNTPYAAASSTVRNPVKKDRSYKAHILTQNKKIEKLISLMNYSKPMNVDLSMLKNIFLISFNLYA